MSATTRSALSKALIYLGVGVTATLALSALNALRAPSRQRPHAPLSAEAEARARGASARLRGAREATLERLSAALRFEITARDEAPPTVEQTEALWRWLAGAFPRARAGLSWRAVGQSLLLTWEARDPVGPPALLLAHVDTVPAEGSWTHPPHSGARAEGYIWGRGALDDRASAVAILEAIELLLEGGYRPTRTLYVAFGHDEEIGGEGAKGIAALLGAELAEAPEGRRRLAWVLDEGGAITEGLVPGLSAPVALVGVAEKGYLTLELRARAEGGHSSMPPAHTAAGRLSAALARLEDTPAPVDLSASVAITAPWLAPELPALQRWALSNLWLTAPIVTRIYEARPSSAALLRTTAAVTQLSASPKENVLPLEAVGVVNLRLLPGDSVAAAVARVVGVVGELGVEVRARAGASEPTARSAVEGDVDEGGCEGWRRLHAALAYATPGVLIAPYLTLGATDSRHYAHLSQGTYRLSALRLGPADLARVHGVDERVGEEDYLKLIELYVALVAPDLAPELASAP